MRSFVKCFFEKIQIIKIFSKRRTSVYSIGKKYKKGPIVSGPYELKNGLHYFKSVIFMVLKCFPALTE